uniref:Uncharacterized protein n=1 Tax=Romanomermis culicivorax TaxID=13658 RepID=A0A915L0J7_ROMCU
MKAARKKIDSSIWIEKMLNLIASLIMMGIMATWKPVQQRVIVYSYLIIHIRKPTMVTNSVSQINVQKQKQLTKALAASTLVQIFTRMVSTAGSFLLSIFDVGDVFEIGVYLGPFAVVEALIICFLCCEWELVKSLKEKREQKKKKTAFES